MTTDAFVGRGRGVVETVARVWELVSARRPRGAGVTPYTLFPHFQRMWDRTFEGGAVAIYGLGPKEVQFESLKTPLYASRFFRNGMRGAAMGMLDLFCVRSWVKEIPTKQPLEALCVFRAQWA
jgi:hypothetical protein